MAGSVDEENWNEAPRRTSQANNRSPRLTTIPTRQASRNHTVMRFQFAHIATSSTLSQGSQDWCGYSLPAAIEVMSIRQGTGGIAKRPSVAKAALGFGRLGSKNDQISGAPA